MAATTTIAARLDAKKVTSDKFQHDPVLNTDTIHDDPLPDRLDAKKVLKDEFTN